MCFVSVTTKRSYCDSRSIVFWLKENKIQFQNCFGTVSFQFHLVARTALWTIAFDILRRAAARVGRLYRKR